MLGLSLRRFRAAISLVLCLNLVAACGPTLANIPAPPVAATVSTNIAPAVSSVDLTAATSTLGAIAANKRRLAPTPPVIPAVAYDSAIGSGVDSNGFVTTPLRAGAHRYFVKPSGSDANGCSTAENPATPLATISAGLACVAKGDGDQVLLAEGATFNEALPWLASKWGFSAAYPTVISSYDPADPTNESKYGRGDQRNARPILTAKETLVTSGLGPRYLVIKGLHFNPGNVDGSALAFVTVDSDPTNSTSFVLVENNLFDYTGLSFDVGPGSAYVGQHIVVRNNAMHGMWSTGGITGCLYTAGVDGVTAEDNVFYHCGWNEAGARDAPQSSGGPTIFQHSYYFQTDTTNVVARRNLSIAGGGDCGIGRGDITVTESLFINCPNAMGLGTGPAYNTDFGSSDGVNIQASYNAVLGSDNVTPTHPLGWGLTTGNGLPGSHADHNLFVRSAVINDGAATLFSNGAFDTDGNGSVPPSYMTFDSNVAYLWAPAGSSNWTQADGFAGQVHTTYTNNKWDDPASGSNTQSSAGSFPNPYTEASLYSALGYANLNALVSYAIAHPEAHVQRVGLDLLLAGYGITHGPPPAPTLTDLALSSVTYTRGAPASGSITGATLGSSIGATGPPAGLTIDGTGRTWAWDGSGTGAASGTFSLSETLTGATNSPHSSTIAFTINAAPAAATWDFATSSADWTISPDKLTVTRNANTGFWATARVAPAKSSGAVIYTINSFDGGAFPAFIGFDAGNAAAFIGNDNSSVGWRNDGGIYAASGAIATVATFGPGDQIKEVKSGSVYTFYKMVGGSWVLQFTMDAADAVYGLDPAMSGAVKPAISNGNNTGTSVTVNTAGW